MKIKIEFDGEVYYRDCSQAYRWNGRLKGSPDWIVDYVEDGYAVVSTGDKALLFLGIHNGYPRIQVGDIVIKDGKNIDVIRRAATERGYSDG